MAKEEKLNTRKLAQLLRNPATKHVEGKVPDVKHSLQILKGGQQIQTSRDGALQMVVGKVAALFPFLQIFQAAEAGQENRKFPKELQVRPFASHQTRRATYIPVTT